MKYSDHQLLASCRSSIVRDQRSRSHRSKPNLVVSGLVLQFEVTYGDEMMHKAWFGIGDVPYCFSRSSIKFQGYTAKKMLIWTQIGHFLTVTQVWIHRWLWNDAQSFKKKWYTELGVAWKGCPIVFQSHLSNFKVYCFSRSSAKFQGHTGQEIIDFDPNWAFLDCYSSLISLMAMQWCTKLEVA